MGDIGMCGPKGRYGFSGVLVIKIGPGIEFWSGPYGSS